MAKKIPVSAPQAPLLSPFAHLQMENLPEGHDAPPEPAVASPAKKRPRIVLRRETSHRGGKTVIVVSQLPTHLSPPELENLSRRAKQSCGCGGSLIGREIELQGDNPARVRAFFEKEGFQVAGIT